MGKFLVKLILPIVKKVLIKQLEERQEEIVTIVNKKLDLPKLDEAQEKKLFDSIYDALQEVIKILTKKL